MTESNERLPCNEEGCNAQQVALGLCKRCYQRARYRDHSESALIYQLCRRHGIAPFYIPPAGWLASQLKSQNGRCGVCQSALLGFPNQGMSFRIPLEDGGIASFDNLIMLCRSCWIARGWAYRTEQVDHTKPGGAIRAQRMNSGLSLRKMARRLDMSAQYLSDIERGNRAVPANLPAKVQKALAIVR